MKPFVFNPTINAKNSRLNETATAKYQASSHGNEGDYRILVAYASEFGTTREVAEFIGQSLCCRSSTSVEVRCINDVNDLEKYDATIIGGAIQYDKWLPDVTNFVKYHQQTLNKIPVAFFFTCMTLAVQHQKAEYQARIYSQKLLTQSPIVKPICVGGFAGAIDLKNMPFLFRQIFRIISLITGVKAGDHRDWKKIHSWTESTYSKMLACAEPKI